MEHSYFRFPYYFCLRALGIAILACGITSCKNPEPNPELLDPVYRDLSDAATASTAAADAQVAKIKKAKEELDKMGSRDPFRKRKIAEIYGLERAQVQLDQQKEYFEIRKGQRLQYARRSCMEAYRAEKPWPDPEDGALYLERKKMRQISLNWSDRVPKTTRYNKPDPNAKPAPPPAEAAPAHH